MSNNISPEVRQAVFAETNGHCAYCGCELDRDGLWHIDHVVPKAQQGSDDENNLLPACHRCNIGKKDRHPETYRAFIKESMMSRLLQADERVRRYAAFFADWPEDVLYHINEAILALEARRLYFYIDGLGEDERE